MKDSVQRSTILLHGGVLIGYWIVSIGLTWPLITHWNTSIVGGISGFTYHGSFGDGVQNIWNMWWVRQAFENRQNPFWSTKLYYPEGVQMYMQTMNITNAIFTLPVQYLAGTLELQVEPWQDRVSGRQLGIPVRAVTFSAHLPDLSGR